MSDSVEIQLNGCNEPFYARLMGTHNTICASCDSAFVDSKGNRTQLSSNKIRSSPISNFSWPYCYYTGNNVAVHKSSGVLGYTLMAPNKEDAAPMGKIRIFDQKLSRKCLIPDFLGNPIVLRFSPSEDFHLAVVDSFGILYLYRLTNDSEALAAEKQLVIHPQVDQSIVKFAGLCWKDNSHVIWSHENRILIANVNKCLEAASQKIEKVTFETFSECGSDFQLVTDHSDTITMISLSANQQFICSSSLGGSVFIHKFGGNNCVVEQICKLEPQPDCGLHSAFLLAMNEQDNSGLLLTGSQFNQELVLTRFQANTSIHNVQHVIFKPSKEPSGHSFTMEQLVAVKVQPQLIISVVDEGFVFLSDIKRGVLYCIELGESDQHGPISFLSISEFIVNAPCISLVVTGVTREVIGSDPVEDLDSSSLVPLGGEASNDQRTHPHYSKWVNTEAQLFTIQPSSLQSRKLSFKLPVWSSWGGGPLPQLPDEDSKKESVSNSEIQGGEPAANELGNEAEPAIAVSSGEPVEKIVNGYSELNEQEGPSNVHTMETISMMLRPEDFPVSPGTEDAGAPRFTVGSPDSSGEIVVPAPPTMGMLTPNMIGSHQGSKKRERSPSPEPMMTATRVPIVEPRLRDQTQPLSTGIESVLLEISTQLLNQSQMMESFIDSLDEQKRNLNTVCTIQSKLADRLDRLESAIISDSASDQDSVVSAKTSSAPKPVVVAKENDTATPSAMSNRSISRSIQEMLKQMRTIQGDSSRKFNIIEQTLNSQKATLDRIQANSAASSSKQQKPAVLTPNSFVAPPVQPSYTYTPDVLAQAFVNQFRPILQAELKQHLTSLPHLVCQMIQPTLNKVSTDMLNMPSRTGDIVNKALRDKSLINTMAGQLQSTMSNAHRDVIAKQILPAFTEGINKMFLDLNTVFSSGTKQYLQNTDLKFKSLEDRLYQRIMDSQLALPDPSIINMSKANSGAPVAKSTPKNAQTDLFANLAEANNNGKLSASLPVTTKQTTAKMVKPAALMSTPVQPVATTVSKKPSNLANNVQLSRWMQEAHDHLQRNAPEQALIVALNSTHQPFLLDILRDIDRKELFKKPLEQSVMLSLVNQLCCGDFKDELELKISYLQDSLSHLDKHDQITAHYVGPLMKILDNTVAQLIKDNLKLAKTNPSRLSDLTLSRLSTLTRVAQTMQD